jgi:predicted nucleotidyltransferase
MSVLSFLTKLSSSAVLSRSDKLSIVDSIEELNYRLSLFFHDDISDSFCFGSFTRGTILPRSIDPFSDVDYMIVFNNTYNKQTYFDKLKKFANSYYSDDIVYQDFPTVAIELNHIRFELVPAKRNFLGDYKILSSGKHFFNKWTSTYPNDFNQDLNRCNVMNGKTIRPLIRIMKCWNVFHGYPIDSYMLEKTIIDNNYYYLFKLSKNLNLRDLFFKTIKELNNDFSIDAFDETLSILELVNELENKGHKAQAEKEIKKVFFR